MCYEKPKYIENRNQVHVFEEFEYDFDIVNLQGLLT